MGEFMYLKTSKINNTTPISSQILTFAMSNDIRLDFYIRY